MLATADINELLFDADSHHQGQVIVYQYQENKVGVCTGGLTKQSSPEGWFLGTADNGYYVGNQHLIVKETSPTAPATVVYRVMLEEVELLNIVLSN